MRPDDRMRPRLMAVRDQDFKLVINFSEKRDYLYDLKDDPGECSPLPASVRTPERAGLFQVAQRHLQASASGQRMDLRLGALLRELQQSAKMTGATTASPMAGEERWASISSGGAQS
jgi:hypothetical protein